MARTTKRVKPIDVQVGQRIREIRLSLGITQQVLADAIGVSFQQVQKYELGVNRIAVSTLVAIAAALDVKPATLLPSSDGDAFIRKLTVERAVLAGRMRSIRELAEL